ncbi:MAG TPA: glycosyltransferase [Verrucomicrobiae bacterium]|nr:glycosyltransferase [Verrucomicrobiae bacterium]
MAAQPRPVAMGGGGRPVVAVLSLHASPLARLGERENGGLNVYVRAVCEELDARGIGTDVFVRRTSPREPGERSLGPRSRVIAVEAGPPRVLPKSQLASTRAAFLGAVREYIGQYGLHYQALHSHYWLTGDVAFRLAAELDLPWLHTAHTLAAVKAEHGFAGDEPERLLAERRVVTQGARLVASTPEEVRDLCRLYGARPDQCVVAPPGVDLLRFRPRDTTWLRTRLGLDGRLVALFAGRLEPLKGPDLLIEALAALDRSPWLRLSQPVHGLFAGDDSSDGARVGQRQELARRAQALGLTGRVTFTGALPQERLARVYSLADVVVVPSHTESFGLVALEALACGTPVVAAAVGGLRHVAADGITGSLVAGREPEAWAAAIASMLSDPLRRERLGRAARRRAETFTWERTVDVLAAEYGLEPAPELAAGRCV